MRLSNWALENRLVVLFIIAVTVLGGIYSFNKMSKLEDPELKVKTAMVVCVYPGASAHEVELRLTDKLEKAIRTMSDIKHVKSRSLNNYCELTIELLPTVKPNELDQKWDILRKKIKSAKLPSGAQTPIVLDDFGDVYGLFYSLSSDGYDFQEMNNYADYIKNQFLIVKGVRKVVLYGKQEPVINVNLSKAKLANLGMPPMLALSSIKSQTEMVYAGDYLTDKSTYRVAVNNTYKTLEDIKNLVIQDLDGKQAKLRDVADVEKTYKTNFSQYMTYNKKPALGIAISIQPGENIINVGKRLDKRIEELNDVLPAGLSFNKVFFQPEKVSIAIDSFMINLIESVAIVILVLMFTMGLRSGVLLGYGLVLTILGTFVVLSSLGGTLQRVSLASIIVAMGMLVDNAIVVIDGILVDLKNGVDRNTALTRTANKTAVPLLGATFIAIFAFLPIFLSPDTSGEYTKDLFIVMAVSLLLSWIFALTQTPVSAKKFLKLKRGAEDKGPSKMIIKSQKFIEYAIKHKYLVLVITCILIALSGWSSKFMKSTFFPDLSYNQIYVEYKMPYGTRSEVVNKNIEKVEDFIKSYPEVTNITRSIGGTPARYNLVRTISERDRSYGELIVDFKEPKDVNRLIVEIQEKLTDQFPEAVVRAKKYNLMYKKFPVVAEFKGADPKVLRDLTKQAMEIMEKQDITQLVDSDWAPKAQNLIVDYNQNKARRSNLSRKDVAISLLAANGGLPVDHLHEGNTAIPIMVNSVEDNGSRIDQLNEIPVWGTLPIPKPSDKYLKNTVIRKEVKFSELANSVPLSQVSSGIKIEWQNPEVRRIDGERAMKAQACPKFGHTAQELLDKVKSDIENIKLPEGYEMNWRGEYEASTESKSYLALNVPLACILILFILVLLFKDYKKPIIILLSLPTVVIGIVFGIILTGKEFGFTSIVGAIGLMGMMIKNGVVLIDEIVFQINSGVDQYKAVVESAVSRIRPVSMASLTTILGMLPLVSDDMFGGMAVTIMSGLLIGTLTVIILIPVLYSVFFSIKK